MDFEKIVSQFAAVAATPVPFTVAALVAAGIAWWMIDWRYSTLLANRDSEISLLKGQRDDYKEKLNGATPDQAKARIEKLEAKLAEIEPRRISQQQRATLIPRLKRAAAEKPPIVVVASEGAGDNVQLAADLASVFRAAGGWNVHETSVIAISNRPASGILVNVRDKKQMSPEATSVVQALRDAQIEFDLKDQPRPTTLPMSPYDGADPWPVSVEILICTRIRS